jgi:hypothetical protein
MPSLLSVLVALVVLLSAVPSWACSVDCGAGMPVSPVNGATFVPLNAQVRWRVDGLRHSLTLDGGAVPTMTMQEGRYEVVTPLQPLAPNTVYSMQSDGLDVGTFVTGTALDTTPPTLAPGSPTVRFSKSPLISFDSCSDLQYEDFSLTQAATDDVTPASALVFLGFIGNTTEDIFEREAAVQSVGSLSLSYVSYCGSTSTMPDLPRRAQLAARLVVADLAGNRSSASEAVQLRGGGCESTGGTAVLLGLLPMVRTRRKR